MPANRMNRDEFYAAMAPNDDARLRKILWALYWRGNAQLRVRIGDELRSRDETELRPKKELPDIVLDEVTTFVKLAKDGAYMAGDRRVHHTERSKWRLTFQPGPHINAARCDLADGEVRRQDHLIRQPLGCARTERMRHMLTVSSEDEIRRLLQDRPDRTQTYQVTEELARRIPLDLIALRRMDEAELRELAEYLDVDVERLAGPFRVVDAECPRCGRRVTFLDFVKTAVGEGVHDQSQLRAVLTGEAGNWITIRGRDGGRPVACANCGQLLRMLDGYSEYSSSSYAYA